jgi:hypothetical protein
MAAHFELDANSFNVGGGHRLQQAVLSSSAFEKLEERRMQRKGAVVLQVLQPACPCVFDFLRNSGLRSMNLLELSFAMVMVGDSEPIFCLLTWLEMCSVRRECGWPDAPCPLCDREQWRSAACCRRIPSWNSLSQASRLRTLLLV